MATTLDATLSMYTRVKKLADTLGIGFASTTSIESASTVLMDSTDKLILVQTKLEDKIFLIVEYKIFVSFSEKTDINSIREAEIFSKVMEEFPLFSKVCVYEAEGLKRVPSEYIDTGKAMVIKGLRQDVVSITQQMNNLNTVAISMTGYIK